MQWSTLITKLAENPFKDVLPYATSLGYQHFRTFLDTGISRILAGWWSVTLCKPILFFGIPIFRKHPSAQIHIGGHCIFRSAEWSNTIGINRRCVISAGKNAEIKIGNQCGFSGTVIAADRSIIIGDRVLCGANCTIVDTDRHPVDALARTQNKSAETFPIIIEDDVFLGMNVVVLKGVTIGRGSVVAANSVVTKSLPKTIIAAGNPARPVKSIMA